MRSSLSFLASGYLCFPESLYTYRVFALLQSYERELMRVRHCYRSKPNELESVLYSEVPDAHVAAVWNTTVAKTCNRRMYLVLTGLRVDNPSA